MFQLYTRWGGQRTSFADFAMSLNAGTASTGTTGTSFGALAYSVEAFGTLVYAIEAIGSSRGNVPRAY